MTDGSTLRVPDGVTLLVGGARSGKSSLAVRLGCSYTGPVTFVATATAGDDDMERRIERHRAERPSTWATIESPLLDGSVPTDGLVIVDCLTMWASNLMLGDVDAIAERSTALVAAWSRRRGPTIVISNEVGLGVVPATELGRRFRDVLGRVNATVAAGAQQTYFLSAGMLLPLLPIESVLQ